MQNEKKFREFKNKIYIGVANWILNTMNVSIFEFGHFFHFREI